MKRLLYRLLKAYFLHNPRNAYERSYRQILIIGIYLYRWLIKPFSVNKCQFAISCSQYTLSLIKSPEPFEVVRKKCLQRYCECSKPFDCVRIGNNFVFISCQGRQLGPQEYSQDLSAAPEKQ